MNIMPSILDKGKDEAFKEVMKDLQKIVFQFPVGFDESARVFTRIKLKDFHRCFGITHQGYMDVVIDFLRENDALETMRDGTRIRRSPLQIDNNEKLKSSLVKLIEEQTENYNSID